MAVAVKNASEAAPAGAMDRLAASSLLGALYVLGSIGVVFYAIPSLWTSISIGNVFITAGLQLLVMVVVAVGLAYGGYRLAGPNPAHGLRAGVGVGILSLFGICLVTWIVGSILQSLLPAEGIWHSFGLGLMAATGLALLYYGARAFFRPKFEETLITIEDQGWFSATRYKSAQGLRVRRGTMVGVLALFGCGIGTLYIHHTLDTVGYNRIPGDIKSFVNTWAVSIPFTDVQVPVLRDVRFTALILLSAIGLWIAFRIVNFPTFADFLIATEAEMNKVSWASRKRLWQDTIVVLVTVVLLTIFLMLVDLMWGFILTEIGVLNKAKQDTTTQGEVEW
jgi:preprotein translocase SecE subunit